MTPLKTRKLLILKRQNGQNGQPESLGTIWAQVLGLDSAGRNTKRPAPRGEHRLVHQDSDSMRQVGDVFAIPEAAEEKAEMLSRVALKQMR